MIAVTSCGVFVTLTFFSSRIEPRTWLVLQSLNVEIKKNQQMSSEKKATTKMFHSTGEIKVEENNSGFSFIQTVNCESIQ